MPAWGWALIIAAVVVVVVAIVLFSAMRKRRRTHALKDRFGEEYDRRVDESGRRRAESRLADVADRHDHLELKSLNGASRARYLDRWTALQAQFVDQPGHVLASADVLVADVMRERGYPVDDFDEQADHVAIDHPDVVRYYRSAHETQERTRTGLVSTEEARVAMLQYRALFEELVDGAGDETAPPAAAVESPAEPAAERRTSP
jgi:hypothetical protein